MRDTGKMLGYRLASLSILFAVAFLAADTARAEIDWTYQKPPTERSAGQWLKDVLGLSEFGRDYAVIVGLHNFENFNPLNATQNDPQRIYEFLKDQADFDYILVLRDGEVTYPRLRSLFEFELPRVLNGNDRLLFFWSGHGTQFQDARKVELGYLPLISSPSDDKSTMVAMTDLSRWDNELPAQQVLFLLDACFAGLAGKTTQGDEEKDLEIRELAKPGHHIISAGGKDQKTIASSQDWQGTIFTHALLHALSGSADRYGGDGKGDGVINLYELVADMSETIKTAKADVGWNRPLRPVLNVFRGEGQFFFLTPTKKHAHTKQQGDQTADKAPNQTPKSTTTSTSLPITSRCDPQADQIFWNAIQHEDNAAAFESYLNGVANGWLCGSHVEMAQLKLQPAPGPVKAQTGDQLQALGGEEGHLADAGDVADASDSGFRIEGNLAIAPDGTAFARKFRKGVFNFGTTTAWDFVIANYSAFSGTSPSSAKVVAAVSVNNGKLDAIGTWDNSFLTFGAFQWTAGSGDGKGQLPGLISRLKADDADAFNKYFGQYGLDVAEVNQQVSYVTYGRFSLNGKVLRTASEKEVLRSLEWPYRFWIAGQDPSVQQAEIEHAASYIDAFYRTEKKQVHNRLIADYVTSEYGVALLLDQYVSRPGHVTETLRLAVDTITQELGSNDPTDWGNAEEERLLDLYLNFRAQTSMLNSQERALRIKGAVDAGIISGKRGTFKE